MQNWPEASKSSSSFICAVKPNPRGLPDFSQVPCFVTRSGEMPILFDNGLAFVAGMGVSCFFVAVLEMLGHSLFPMPANVNYKDKEQLKRVIKKLPLGAFLMVELAYVVGSLAGGFVVARFASTRHIELACGLGFLLTLFGFQNLLAIPHPRWFAVLSTVTYIPLTYAGAKAYFSLL